MSVDLPTYNCPTCRIAYEFDRVTWGGTGFWVCPECLDEIRHPVDLTPDDLDDGSPNDDDEPNRNEPVPSPITCGYHNLSTGLICSRIVSEVGERCWQHEVDPDTEEVDEE